MGFFAFMYYQSFIAVYKASVGSVIEVAINGLSVQEQVEVVKGLTKHLVNRGVISAQVGLALLPSLCFAVLETNASSLSRVLSSDT